MIIGYYLPGMEVGAGGWATTHFNPDLEIRVLGMTPKQLETLIGIPSVAAILPQELIGIWFWELGDLSHRISIYQRQGILYMEKMFLDGSNSNDELVEKASSQGRKFSVPGTSYGDYYLLDNHGDLYMGDAEGSFEKLQKIDTPSQTTTSSQTTTQPSPAPIAASPEPSPAPANSSTDTNDKGGSTGKKVGAWAATTTLIKSRLTAPRTAKFNGGAWDVAYLGDNRYRVKGSVDSQNSFGAMIRTEFQAIVRDEGDEDQTWVLEDLQTSP